MVLPKYRALCRSTIEPACFTPLSTLGLINNNRPRQTRLCQRIQITLLTIELHALQTQSGSRSASPDVALDLASADVQLFAKEEMLGCEGET